MSKLTQSPLFWFILLVILIAILTFFGPEEQSLGANVRIVYLHGAWVLTALAALAAAGVAGLTGLLTRRAAFHRWSQSLGWSGMVFWITYLPLSRWAMQANWNGLFLAEPRMRLAFIFAIVGVLLQIGLLLVSRPWLTSAANVIFIAVLQLSFARVSYVMHPPPSPIFNSGIWRVEAFFIGLNLLTLLAAYFLTRTIQRFGESTKR